MAYSKKWPRNFQNFARVLRESTLNVELGSQKWPKLVLLQKIEVFCWDPPEGYFFVKVLFCKGNNKN